MRAGGGNRAICGEPGKALSKRYNGHPDSPWFTVLELALKQRLLGAVLLILLGVLIIPMLLDTQRPDLARPLQDVAASEELVFTHQAFPAARDGAADPAGPGARAPGTLGPQNKWYIQVGRFQNTAKAAEIRDTMRTAGYPSRLFPKKTSSGKIHQLIWVGPYPSQRKAESVLGGIKAKKSLTAVHEGWVVRQP